jgi:uncharacterized membrane protein YfhO
MGLARMSAASARTMTSAKWEQAVSAGARIARIDPLDSSDYGQEYEPPYFELRDAVPGERVGPDEIVLKVDASRVIRGYVVVSEKQYPGWRAEVDGAEGVVCSANGTFLAVEVYGTTRDVRLRYRPGWLTTVLATSLLSLAIAVVIVVRRVPSR